MVITLESTRIFSSDATGNWIGRVITWLHPVGVQQIILANFFLRKLGHFTGYALLSAFFFHGWMETVNYRTGEFLRRSGKQVQIPQRWHMRAAVLAVLCTLIIASIDEFHQSLLPGRTGTYRDVILDMMGGAFAQIALLIYWSRSQTREVSRISQQANEVVAENS
jgi:hypothetical protein